MPRWVVGVQPLSVAFFTLALAGLEPMLLVHPLGMLSKNLPFLLCVSLVARPDREGWTSISIWQLRVAMAIVWPAVTRLRSATVPA